MPCRIALLSVIALLAGMMTAQADGTHSVYSSTAGKDCRRTSLLKVDGDDYASTRTCRGPAGWVVVIDEEDLRETVSAGRSAAAASRAPAAAQGFGPFNSTSPTVEWRIRDGVPLAMIQRWRIADNDDTGGRPTSKAMLVITRLAGGAACHVAYVDVAANPDANTLARQVADDRAPDFDCDSDKVTAAGRPGRTSDLTLPRR